MQDDANLPAQWAKEDTSHLEVQGATGDLDDFSQPLIIYNDRRQAIQKLNRRMMFAAPLLGIYVMSAVSMHLYVLGIFMVAWFALMYLWVVRRFNANVEPLMKVDSNGITVHGLLTHCHIDWDNLKEVRPYTFFYKFVGMDAKNVWKLQASMPMKILLFHNTITTFVYRLIGVKMHSINVPEQYSHFKAEDLCEQIEKRREHFLGLPNQSATSQPTIGEQVGATIKLPVNEDAGLKIDPKNSEI